MQLISSFQTTVLFCAGAGFVIVWLVFPSKDAKTPFASDDPTSAENSHSPPPIGEKESGRKSEEAPKSKATYGSQRPRWCDILLLEPDASPAAIRKAYARLMKGLHPDLADADYNTSRQCTLVQEAYQQAMEDRQTRT